MSELTIEELKEKIKRVKQDIDQLKGMGDGGRKLDTLCEYVEYLEEELIFLVNENNKKT